MTVLPTVFLAAALAQQPAAPELELAEGWARVLVANRPLYPGEVVREEDLYAIQIPAEHLPPEPLPPEQVVGRQVTAPLFRNELVRAEVLGDPKTDPLRVAPSRTFLWAVGGEAPGRGTLLLVADGCAVAEVDVIQAEPAVVAIAPDTLAAALTPASPTLALPGSAPPCDDAPDQP